MAAMMVISSLLSSLCNGTFRAPSYIQLAGSAEAISGMPLIKAMAMSKAAATTGNFIVSINALKEGATGAGKALTGALRASGAVTFELGFGDLPLKSIAVNLAQSGAIPLVLGFLEGFFVEIVPEKWKGRVKWALRIVNIVLTCGGIALFLSNLFLTGGTVSLLVIVLSVVVAVFCYFFGRFLGKWTSKGLIKLGSWIKAKWHPGDDDNSQPQEVSVSLNSLLQQNYPRNDDFDSVPDTQPANNNSHAHREQGIMHAGACICCYESVARVVFLSRNPCSNVCSHAAVCFKCFEILNPDGQQEVFRCPVDQQEVLDIFIFPTGHDVRGCNECLEVGLCEHCNNRTRNTICWLLTNDGFLGEVRYCNNCVDARHVDTTAYARVSVIRPGGHSEQ